MYNNKNTVYFVLISPNRPHYSFNSYSDKDGNLVYISNRTDNFGNPIFRRFSFGTSNRVMAVPRNQKDVIDFLRNNPECEGSPNNFGQPFVYKEMNTEKDAEIGLMAQERIVEAQTIALSLKGQELVDVAALCGSFSESEKILKFFCMEFAGKNPNLFMEHVNSLRTDGHYRSTIKRGIEIGVLKKKGQMVLWNDELIGEDEDAAVAKLSKDKKVFDSVKVAIAKAK